METEKEEEEESDTAQKQTIAMKTREERQLHVTTVVRDGVLMTGPEFRRAE